MNIYWKSTVASGSFTTASNWVQGAVPGLNDVAEITSGPFVSLNSGSPVTVLGINVVVGTLAIVSDLTATEGTAIGANRGTIELTNGAEFDFGGNFKNINTLNDNSGTLGVVDTDVTLSGAGAVGLASNTAIINIRAGLSLTNVDNLIAGQGAIQGGGTLINQTKGVINASISNEILFATNIRNTGMLEASSLGILEIDGRVDNHGGGIINTDTGHISLSDGADIIGGTLGSSSTSTPLISVDGTVVFDGSKSSVPTNTLLNTKGAIQVSAGSNLDLQGTIRNLGTWDVQTATININGTVTLQGLGRVELTDSRVEGAGATATLANVNDTIEGRGTIGGGGLKLNNEVGGIIKAQSGQFPLVIDTGANTIVNAGQIRADNGTLFIASNLNNSGGKLHSSENHTLYAEGNVTGGSATIDEQGIIEFGSASSAATTFATGSTGQLVIDKSANYSGTIGGFGANTTQSIDLTDFNFTGAHATSFSAGVLTLTNSSGKVVHLNFSGTHTLASFHLSDDGNFNGTADGTKITDPPVTSSRLNPLNNLMGLFTQYIAAGWKDSGAPGNILSQIAPLSEQHILITQPHAH
jgi:hypothetical protein